MPSKMHIQPDQQRTTLIRAAIAAAGGTVQVARTLGYKTAERVRGFYAPGYPVPAEKCRAFVRMSHGLLNLRTVRPDLYDGLTLQELGYQPLDEEAAA
jgi:hypothetical protein